ncbi:MAG: WYL domain-containing protein [Candidatus Margulisbacteria bacterium]|jgi:predicted DNA-binding transcriptional regulator YafY|nr:WYL domain-containing protein [Candidatus Margulisiibacteriota bacterium]
MKQAKNLDQATLLRVYQIDHAIRGGEYPNCTTLAKQFDPPLSARTIARDIETMKKQFQAEIFYDPKHNGYYYAVGRAPLLRELTFADGELLALLLIRRLLTRADQPTKNIFLRVLNKLKMLAPDKTILSAENIGDLLSVEFKIPEIENLSVYHTLLEALQRKVSVRVKYFDPQAGALEHYEFDPYHLRYSKSDWYAVGFCHETQKLRVLAAANIKQLKISGVKFRTPEDFNAAELFSRAWFPGRKGACVVKLRFVPRVARWLGEKVWHPAQKTTILPSGALVLELPVEENSGIIDWILSFGGKVEVLEPRELREAVQQEALAILKNTH